MSSVDKQQPAEDVVGLLIVDDYSAVEKAHLKRHPQHCDCIPIDEVKPLSHAESAAYSALNMRLHEEMGRVSKEYFANTPIPEELQDADTLPCFTPFTYQNYDWYQPSYECYIVVIGKYIDLRLLKKFQQLLVEDHRDWCIQVVVSKSNDIDDGHHIAVFSDQVIVQSETAAELGIQADP